MVEEHFIHCLLAYQGACPGEVGGIGRFLVNGVLYQAAYPTTKHSQPPTLKIRDVMQAHKQFKSCHSHHAQSEQHKIPICQAPGKMIQAFGEHG